MTDAIRLVVRDEVRLATERLQHHRRSAGGALAVAPPPTPPPHAPGAPSPDPDSPPPPPLLRSVLLLAPSAAASSRFRQGGAAAASAEASAPSPALLSSTPQRGAAQALALASPSPVLSPLLARANLLVVTRGAGAAAAAPAAAAGAAAAATPAVEASPPRTAPPLPAPATPTAIADNAVRFREGDAAAARLLQSRSLQWHGLTPGPGSSGGFSGELDEERDDSSFSPSAFAGLPAFLSPALASAPPPVYVSPLAVDLGPEFAAVLARDFARNGNWAALRAMGALDGGGEVFSSVASGAAFLTPPPMPRPAAGTTPMTRPPPQPFAASENVQHEAAAVGGVGGNDVDGDDDNEEEEEEEEDGEAEGAIAVTAMPGAGPPLVYSGAALRGDVPRTAAPDLVVDGDEFAPLERVALQLRLLGAQADALGVQADRLEMGMAEEAHSLDVARTQRLMQRRGAELRALRERADVLLAKTTNAVAGTSSGVVGALEGAAPAPAATPQRSPRPPRTPRSPLSPSSQR